MIGLADGFKMGWGLTTDAMERKRRQAIEDEQLTWQREDRARQNADRTRVDQAFRDYESLAKNGNVDATGTGLSAPSAQMAYAGNAGYGQGEAAVKEMAGDYAREMGRFAQAPGAPAGGLPKYDSTAPVTTSAASEVDLERALGGIAAAQRDVRGIRESKANTKALKLEEGRRAEVKRLSSMKPEDLVNVFQEQNKDGSGVPAMLGFDAKTNRFVFTSNIPGVPTQTLSRAELMNEMMGLWEAGNGDYAKGLSMMLEGAKTRRELDNQTYNRTAGVAQGNADLYWRDKKFGQDASQHNDRMRLQSQELGLRRDALNLQHPTLSKEDRDALSKIYAAHAEATDPAARAALERQHNMIVQRAALGMGRVPGLLGAGSRPPAEYKAADAIKLAEMLSADPANKGKSQQEIFEMARQTLINQGSGGWENPYGQPGPQKPAAPQPAQPAQPARSLFNGAPTQQPAAPGPGSWLYRGGAAPQVAPQGRGDSLIEMYQAREAALPPGVTTSGLGYMVNGRAYFSRDEALRAAGY